MSPKCQVNMVTKFDMVVLSICGSSVWTLLHVALQAPRILRWSVDFWKICAPLALWFM